MTNPTKALAAIREAGLDFDLTRFNHRLIAQKLVYLIQEYGVRLGYEGTYSFYVRGAYSPTLTKDLFAAAKSGDEPTPAEFTEQERKRIRLIQEKSKLRPHILEVMAAYRHLRKQGRSQQDAVRRIKTGKPFISPRDVAIGVSICKGLWPEVTEADIRSMREEMEPWDRAAAEDAL